MVLSHLENLLDEFEWVLSKLKAETSGPQQDDVQGMSFHVSRVNSFS